jgi:hypothetical protein
VWGGGLELAPSHTLPRSAAAGVVEQFPVRPRQLPQAEIEGLVASLLELCSGYEAALRTVISMQKNLERVRRCREVSPEGALLLQEIGRQLEALRDNSTGLGDCLGTAALHLDTVRTSCD